MFQACWGFDNFRFDNQLTQFLREGIRFTLLVAVLEALLIVLVLVLASR